MALRNNLEASFQLNRTQSKWIFLLLTVIFVGVAAVSGKQLFESFETLEADKYYLRVFGCDDGGKAYLNNTLVVDVGFNEDSNWLEITKDLAQGKNEIKFEAINKTGAITYVFQVAKNQTVIFEKSCGKASEIGCENNRAFRAGIAREFTFNIYQNELSYAQNATSKSNTTQTFSKTFRGKLGDPINVSITMKLNRNGKSVSGTLFDESTKYTSKVRGTINANNRIKLYEYDRAGKRIGIWQGNLDSPNQFSGSYSPLGSGAMDGGNFTLVSK